MLRILVDGLNFKECFPGFLDRNKHNRTEKSSGIGVSAEAKDHNVLLSPGAVTVSPVTPYGSELLSPCLSPLVPLPYIAAQNNNLLTLPIRKPPLVPRKVAADASSDIESDTENTGLARRANPSHIRS